MGCSDVVQWLTEAYVITAMCIFLHHRKWYHAERRGAEIQLDINNCLKCGEDSEMMSVRQRDG